MQQESTVTVKNVDKLEAEVIVEFSDDTTAVFSADFLYRNRTSEGNRVQEDRED